MATYNYYKDHQGLVQVPDWKPGSNWVYVKIDFSKQNMAASDVLKLFKVKNHWIINECMGRVVTASDGNSTADIGTTSGGQEIDAAQDPQAGGSSWTVSSAATSDAPLAITADGYIYYELLTNACTSGVTELLFEVIVPHTNVGDATSIAE